MAYDLRLVAYTPWGARLGVLPHPLTFTYTLAELGWPVCDVSYATTSRRAQWLNGKCEVALEWANNFGVWEEPDFGRMLVVGAKWDRVGKTRVRSYRLHGLGWLLDTKMNVWDATPTDPGDGPVLAVRQFVDADAGDLLGPPWSAAVVRVWPAGPAYVNAPGRDFQVDADSDGAAWVETISGLLEIPVEDKLGKLQQLLVDGAVSEPAWRKRTFQQWNWGTYGRDLHLGSTPVTIRDSHGVTVAPESEDWSELVARVMVTGEGGRYLVRDNPDADVEYGSFEDVLAVAGSHDLAAMSRLATNAIRHGGAVREEIVREWHAGSTPAPLPFRDYHIRDRLRVAGHPGGHPVVEISVTRDLSAGISGHVKLKDRRASRLADHMRRLYRMALDTQGAGGLPAAPGTDVRYPLPPTNVQVVTTLYPDVNNNAKGDQTVTWSPVLYDIGTPPALINLRGYDIGERRFGDVAAHIASVGPADLSWRRDNVGAGARDLLVRAVSKAGFPSAWSADADATVAADADPTGGPSQVLDPGFLSATVRSARQARSLALDGPGFAFELVAGEWLAAFTAADVRLPLGAGGTATSGRRSIRPQDTVYADVEVSAAVGTAAVKLAVAFYDTAGAELTPAVVVASGAAPVGSWAVHSGAATAPAGARTMSLRITAASVSAGGKLHVRNPSLDRGALGGVQPADADLSALAAAGSDTNRLPFYTAPGAASLAPFTAAGRALVDDADAAAMRVTLGLAGATWTALDFTASTPAATYGTTTLNPPRWRVLDNRADLRGRVTVSGGAGVAVSDVVAVLPVGARPARDRTLLAATNVGWVRLAVNLSGVMTIQTTDAAVTIVVLDGLHFFLDQ